MAAAGRNNIMSKKHKIAAFILTLGLCLVFIMPYINKHNILSSNKGIKYIAHRGIGGLAPENTLPAFELAGKLGFWGAECDARTTSDGNWMILHDDTVDRMTNGTGQIKNLSLAEVQSLNIIPANNIINYNGIKIPMLQEYLLICKKWGMVPVIDMKPADNLKYYDKFLEILKKYGNIEKTIVISSSATSLNELRKRDTYLTLGLICSNINNSNIYYVKTLGNAFIDCSSHNITNSAVILCHENNIKIGAWIVDDKALADKLIKKGVDFLTTNKLFLLL